MLAQWLERWRWCHQQDRFWLSLLYAAVAFVGALLINNFAIQFATEHAGDGVPDLILSNIPTYNVDGLFVYSTFVVMAITAAFVLWQPKRIPFVLNTLALFLLIRSGFTSLTHVGPFAPITSTFGQTITHSFFGADFFFSGHTGMPFLGALVFWHDKLLRYFYLVCSVAFGVIVLLGHLHYSIDVFSAFFITYSIFHIAQWGFPREYEWLETSS